MLWLALVGIVAVARAADDAMMEPARCCLPGNIFAASIHITGAGYATAQHAGYPIEGSGQLTMDYNKKIQGLEQIMRLPDGSNQTQYYMYDYTGRKIYTRIDNNPCIVSNMMDTDAMAEKCIPADADYIGPATLGYGAHSLDINTWNFTMPIAGGNTAAIILSVTKTTCAPVIEVIMTGDANGQTEFTYFYADVKFLSDAETPLTPPTDCTAATP